MMFFPASGRKQKLPVMVPKAQGPSEGVTSHNLSVPSLIKHQSETPKTEAKLMPISNSKQHIDTLSLHSKASSHTKSKLSELQNKQSKEHFPKTSLDAWTSDVLG